MAHDTLIAMRLLPIPALLTILYLMVGCRRDDGVALGGPVALSPHLFISTDSAFIIAPNIFTPVPDDGVNSSFRVMARNVTSFEITLLNSQGDTVLHSMDPNEQWNGNVPGSNDVTADFGSYSVHISAMSTSGVLLQGSSTVVVTGYGATPCLYVIGTPVCGDQLDPRICGIPYPTNEVFCPQ